MTEGVRGTRTVELERIYADRPDILLRLYEAQQLYNRYYSDELTLEEVSRLIEDELITDPDTDELLIVDARLRGINPLKALRDNMSLGRLLTEPNAPQETPQDSNKAA